MTLPDHASDDHAVLPRGVACLHPESARADRNFLTKQGEFGTFSESPTNIGNDESRTQHAGSERAGSGVNRHPVLRTLISELREPKADEEFAE